MNYNEERNNYTKWMISTMNDMVKKRRPCIFKDLTPLGFIKDTKLDLYTNLIAWNDTLNARFQLETLTLENLISLIEFKDKYFTEKEN